MGTAAQPDRPETAVQPAVPLGGLGTGFVEVGRDGWFRNIAINNNRTRSEWIPVSEASFLAVSIRKGDTVYARYLQLDRPGQRAPEPGEPARLSPEHLEWRGLFPTAHFHNTDPASPVDTTWTLFSPVVPYDHDAATLPVVLASLSFKNADPEPVQVTAVFNWENLCGQTASRKPAEPPPVAPARVQEKPRYEVKFLHKEGPPPSFLPRKKPEPEPEPEPEAAQPDNVLCFGSIEGVTDNAQGEHCLAVRPVAGAWTCVLAWDHCDPEQRRGFWQAVAEGALPPQQSIPPGPARSGAVCLTLEVPARSSKRVDFALAWYCPRFEVNGVDLGNAYTVKRKHACEVAQHALEHVEYHYVATSDWQKRLQSSSLPPWFVRALINSCHVFTTNTLYSRQGAIALFESPDAPCVARLDRRFYSSLGSLLFFPRFEETELSLIATAEQPDCNGRLPRRLGMMTPLEPELGAPAAAYVEIGTMFVLMAYRNYFLSGKLVRLQDLLPMLRVVMARIAAGDANGDGLPELRGTSTTYDGVEGPGLHCYAAGLWVAALCAYARLCGRVAQREEARRYALLLRRAQLAFENRYWNDDAGFYRLFIPAEDVPPAADICHAGQLAGQWYADFLGLGTLFRQDHIARALASIERLNRRGDNHVAAVCADGDDWVHAQGAAGVSEAHWAWPAHARAHLHCLQLYRGFVTEGLRGIERAFETICTRKGRWFDEPLQWDPDSDDAPPDSPGRHMGALSYWHVLYAVQGFLLNVPDQYVRVAPNLPKGVRSLAAPLLTPLCFGWLKYKVDDHGGYRQRLKISFDSPVHIRHIELRVPNEVPCVSVACETADGVLPIKFALTEDGAAQRLVIQFDGPAGVAPTGIAVQVLQAAAPAQAPGAS